MNELSLNDMNLVPLSSAEEQKTEGGYVMLIIGTVLGIGLVAIAGAAIYASFEAGKNQACN